MGFQIVNITTLPPPITINSLTPDMINDLIVCYANNIDPLNVQARYNLPKGLLLDYPIIGADVVQEFYDQLYDLTWGIVAVITDTYTISGSTGPAPHSITDVQNYCFELIENVFFTQESWLYTYSNGNFNAIKPFITQCINIFFQVNGGDFATVSAAVIAAYPSNTLPIN